jgi:hypothetical protein
MEQYAGGVVAVQVKLIEVEVDNVGVSPVGADGTAVHAGVAGVVAAICDEAPDVPSWSTASTMK